MESTFDKEPLSAKGRSRFSKALPLPPVSAPPPIGKDNFPVLTSIPTSLQSPLPPVPTGSLPVPKKSLTMAIPRRPVGVASSDHSRTVSITSLSSVYSDSPGFSRSLSNSSDKTKDSLSGIDSDFGPTPPLPPKDSQRPQLPPKTPTSSTASPTSGFQPSPPRPEIWRRRSVKSDRSIVVSELKLNKSNGSTASPQRQLPPDRQLPTVPSQLPRSLQGRKPVPQRPPPPQPDTSGMGNKLSKLTDKNKRAFSSSSEDVQTQPYSPLNRLPTPEYLKTDKQQPLTPKVLSPETPPDDIPLIPQRSESRSTVTIVPGENALSNTASRPNLLSSHSRDTSETLTITSLPAIMQSPQPQKTYAAKILTPQASLSPENENLSPTLQSPPTNVAVIKFPKFPTSATPGTIFQGPELGVVHFECYQGHKQMRSSKNNLCPVACMICRKKEMGSRWRCSWCCLSACGSCMQVLSSIPGNDLRLCLERIENGGERNQRGDRTGMRSGNRQ